MQTAAYIRARAVTSGAWISYINSKRIAIKGYAKTGTNTAPTVATVIPDQTATAATAFSYAFPATTFSDADSDTLTYTATQADGTALPSWLSFSTSTRTFSGTPQAADVGTVSVKVTASDSSASVSDTFAIVVSAAGDTTAPTLTSATVSSVGTSIDLVFSEAYTIPSTELEAEQFFNTLAGALSVTANSATVGFILVVSAQDSGQGRFTISRLSPAIGQGQTVVVTYTDPTSGDDAVAIQDAAGNDTATFTTGMNSVPAVTNNSTVVVDTTAPTLTSATVSSVGTSIDLVFSEAYTIPSTELEAEQFFNTLAGALSVTANSATVGFILVVSAQDSGQGRFTISRLSPAIGQGQTVVVTYTDPTSGDDAVAIQDAAGNDTATFTTGMNSVPAVTNNSTVVVDTTAPTLTSATVSSVGTSIDLVFSEAYTIPSTELEAEQFFNTLAGALSVTANSATVGFTLVVSSQDSGQGRFTISRLSPAIGQGQTVVVTYTDPTSGDDAVAIQDATGNDAATFTTGMNSVPAVTNNSTVNAAPTVATVIPDQTATAATAFSYAFPATTFSDANGDTLTYTATKADGTALPSWLSFSTSTRTFSGTPQAADVATVSVKVTASDGSASVSDTFDIVVSAAPSLGTTCNAPDLAGRTQIWTNTLNVGGPDAVDGYGLIPTLDNSGTFTDPSNLSISYEANPYTIGSILVRADARLDVFLTTALPSALKAKLAFHVCDEQFAFTDAPYNAGSFLHRYRWTSTGLDWSSESTRTLYMSVLGTTNNAPTVAAVIQDQTATAGTAFSYAFPATTFSDANGDTLTYTATKADGTALPSWLSFSTSTRTFSGTPQTADVATVSVKVTASDGSASVSDTFDIVVSVAVRGAPFGVVVDAPSGAVGLMRARWQVPPNASGIQGYHVRYRTVGTVLGASFQKVGANARELLLRYLEPGANYEAQICTVGSGERRGPCSPWARLQLAARNTVPANDFTVSLELPDGSAKATVAWDGTLTYRIRVRGVYDSSVLEFATSTVGTVATRLGPPGGRVPEFDSYDNNSDSRFSGYRGFARMFIVWDSPSSGYWERTQTVWTPAGANNAHVLELIDKPERLFTNRLNRIGTPSSLCVEITDSSNNVTAACAAEQIEIEPPTVAGTPTVSAAGSDGQWSEGETVEVTLAFSEAVAVETANGVPSVGLGLSGPAATRSAPYLRGGGTAELVFGYTLVDGDGAHTVMAVTPDSLALNGGAIRSVEDERRRGARAQRRAGVGKAATRPRRPQRAIRGRARKP